MIKACIFDMDGTVLDTITTITYYVNKTLKNFGIDTVSEDECKYFAGNGAEKLIERTLKSKSYYSEELFSKALDYYKSEYDKAPLYLTKPFKGILELMDELSARGIKLAVVSNKPDFATKAIAKHFFGDKMDMVLGARAGVPLKPAPNSVIETLNYLGVNSSECAYIGDTSTDIETGKNANVSVVIGVSWGFRSKEELTVAGADLIVNNSLQIKEEIEKLD